MRRGDIIFFYPRTLFQRIIAKKDGKYCHCGILLSSNACLSMTAWGVTIVTPDDYRGFHTVDVYRIVASEETIEKLLAFLISKFDNLKYDWFGLLSFVVPFFKQRPQRFFCSEFLLWGFALIGLHRDSICKTPKQLSEMPYLEIKEERVKWERSNSSSQMVD